MNQPLPVDGANRLLHQLLSQSADIKTTLPVEGRALLQEACEQDQGDRASHMMPTLAPYSRLGQQLAGLHQGNLLSAELYPQLEQAELTSLSWLKSCFNLPYAQFSHGGSYNNLQALWQAREHDATDRRTVYASEACHYSIAKACQILGLELQFIETDAEDRLNADKLARACAQAPPLAVVLTAGTSALGALDPLADGLAVARRYQSWLHIDAAWGGALCLLPESGHYREVIEQADSVCFDPHKSLFQPRPCSVYLSRHSLSQTEQTDYLAAAPTQRLCGSYGGELFLPLWLNLTLLGQQWFADQTRHRLAQADRFAEQLRQSTDFSVFNGGSGIICFQAPEHSLDKLVDGGNLSRARVNGQAVYRSVFAGYQTDADTLMATLRPFL